MAKTINIFTRVEKKYLITREQLDAVMPVLLSHMHEDEYGLSTICSTYFDTPDMRIIRASINAKAYKEKLRMRCYGVPDDDTNSFIELKKKYKGIVYKRRLSLPYRGAMEFLRGSAPAPDGQIAREIAHTLKFYPDIAPMFDIFCERTAFIDNEDANLRLTVDRDLRYRTTELDLTNGSFGEPILASDRYIMEIKTVFSMPLWLVRMLDDAKIYPHKFSKYANAYHIELKKKIADGEIPLFLHD